MAAGDNFRAIAYQVRSIPGQLGLRPIQVAIDVSTWSGGLTGRGTRVRQTWPITESNGQPPKVRELNTEELALGNMGKGSLKIGPITTGFAGGGTPIELLKPELQDGQTLHVLISGPGYPDCGARFEIKSLNTDRALHWTLVVSPVAEIDQ